VRADPVLVFLGCPLFSVAEQLLNLQWPLVRQCHQQGIGLPASPFHGAASEKDKQMRCLCCWERLAAVVSCIALQLRS
jgi:hypothetical protein